MKIPRPIWIINNMNVTLLNHKNYYCSFCELFLSFKLTLRLPNSLGFRRTYFLLSIADLSSFVYLYTYKYSTNIRYFLVISFVGKVPSYLVAGLCFDGLYFHSCTVCTAVCTYITTYILYCRIFDLLHTTRKC